MDANENTVVTGLSDGFYYFEDPRHPGTYGVIHRLNGLTWRTGEPEPFRDDEWVDGVSFFKIPAPNVELTGVPPTDATKGG